AYHAGLAAAERTRNQEAFNRDEVQVMVATIAFGMGIDKSNVRFVVHADLPKNMEGYYQETGRAGRDNEPAHCLLFFSRGDIPKIRYFIDRIASEQERSIALKKLGNMADYASLTVCRRRQLLAYFGELYAEKNCGACDICADYAERSDATREAQIIMSAMVRSEQRFGANHIIDIVTGAQTKKIAQLGHDRLKTFGIGHDRDEKFWHAIINELIGQECISRSHDRYPLLRLLPKGTAILRGEKRFTALKREESVKRRKMAAYEEYNEKLFSRLQVLRKRISDERNVPAFVIFSDKTLHDMCRTFPTMPSELLKIAGVGRQKMDHYGMKFIAVIKKFLQENPAPAQRADGATKTLLKKRKSPAGRKKIC
ncbi:MAG: RQC domain-containing protein, partial [Pseudomonadota bacterium]